MRAAAKHRPGARWCKTRHIEFHTGGDWDISGTETALNGGLQYNYKEVLLEVFHIKTHVNKALHLLTFYKTLALLIDKLHSILQYTGILCGCQPGYLIG